MTGASIFRRLTASTRTTAMTHTTTTITTLTILLLSLLALSAPTTALTVPRQAGSSGSQYVSVTASQLVAMAPETASCSGAAMAGECRTASQAAPWINAGFATYGIANVHEAAALLSLMLFESGAFKYNRNHFPAPGRPGQGTRNMQSAAYNRLYAASLPELQPQLQDIVGGGSGGGGEAGGAGTASGAATAGGNEEATQVLDLLLSNDRYDFASAAWFLTSQCGGGSQDNSSIGNNSSGNSSISSRSSGTGGNNNIRPGLQTGSAQGWQTYLTACVGTTVTDERRAGWQKVAAVLRS